MEGADVGRRLGGKQGVKAAAHFGGGAIGEGDGQDALRREALSDAVGNAMGDNPRFSGAGSGQDKQWAAGVRDSSTLLIVQERETIVDTGGQCAVLYRDRQVRRWAPTAG